MESANAHRKIELQFPEDFAFLIANVRRAAAESIAAAFPPVESAGADKDDLHARVEELVNEYISQTFTLAAPNLTINGLPVDTGAFLPSTPQQQQQQQQTASETETFEPFDGRKRQRVEDLAREEEDLLRDIAALKRKVPGAAAAAYAESVRAGVAADEEALAKRLEQQQQHTPKLRQQDRGGKDQEEEEEEEQGHEGGGGSKKKSAAAGGQQRALLAVKPLERQPGVEAAFAGVVEMLGRLKGGMPATVAKMERARVAGEYVVAGR